MAGGVGHRRLRRGDVFVVQAPLVDRRAGTGVKPTPKWVVLLHDDGAFGNATDVALLVASSLRSVGRQVATYEVLVDQRDGFDHQTVIDARWPMTMLKADIHRGTYKTTLSADVMESVAVALIAGLQMH